MAEINNGKGIKTIAYYLPQYHAIPENDRVWGEGFTEWTNTRKAKPMFEGHYQPKTPLDNNYYNLLNDDVKVWQANLAKKYGVFGFCYYHYWFKNGKKLLEKPVEQMLINKEVDIPFCLSWANENWTKNWDGGNQELIVEQDYGSREEWKQHLEYLIPFFKDSRYITLDGNPVFLIYKPELIPNVQEMLKYWNKEISKYGFNQICFMIQNPNWFFSPTYNMGSFSYQIKFHPFFTLLTQIKNQKLLNAEHILYGATCILKCNKLVDSLFRFVKKHHKTVQGEIKQKRLDYDDIWKSVIDSKTNSKFIEGAFVDWDNTARKLTGYVHVGGSPEKFKKYMIQLFNKVKNKQLQPVIFINAWNEWAEGAYLEPDDKYQYAYLEALKIAIDQANR